MPSTQAAVSQESDVFKRLKQLVAISLRRDEVGNVWFIGREPARDRAVAYRFDGASATRFELPAGVEFPHPDRAFASDGGVLIGLREGVLHVVGDAAKQLKPPGKGLTPRALAAGGGRVFGVFTGAESELRKTIHVLDGSKWSVLATPKVEHLRSLTVFGDRLIAIENNVETSLVLGLDGKKKAAFDTYRSNMRIVAGATRFITFTDSIAEVRDSGGKQVARLTRDEISDLTGENSTFQCAVQVEGDRFLFSVRDQGGGPGAGQLVSYDAGSGKAELHPHSNALKDKSPPSEVAVDQAGRSWLNCGSWEGKTRLLVIDAKGGLSIIKK